MISSTLEHGPEGILSDPHGQEKNGKRTLRLEHLLPSFPPSLHGPAVSLYRRCLLHAFALPLAPDLLPAGDGSQAPPPLLQRIPAGFLHSASARQSTKLLSKIFAPTKYTLPHPCPLSVGLTYEYDGISQGDCIPNQLALS